MNNKEIQEYIENMNRRKFDIADCELVSFNLGGKTWEVKKLE